MMIFKKAIPRRTFLQGMGAALALPLMDGMLPAFASASDVANTMPRSRVVYIYVPNGRIMKNWTPTSEGAAFELPRTLEPLAPFREDILVLSGIDNVVGDAKPGERGSGHAGASASFLTGVHLGMDGKLGISADQIAASELGKYTQLGSLELGLDSNDIVGAGDDGLSAAYTNTLSWRSPSTPLPTENNPRAVFERLFGDSDSTDPEVRRRRMQTDRSILDSMAEDIARITRVLGPRDRGRLNEYTDSVREVERRIQKAEATTSQQLPLMERPAGIPQTYQEHAGLMFDLLVLAYQSDMTRVVTFLMANEKSDRVYREIGMSDGHHSLSHHKDDPEQIARVAEIDLYQSRMLAHFLERMEHTADGDGSLLDHSLVLFGSGISNGNLHLHTGLPLLLIGGGMGIKGARHVVYPKNTELANLHLTILEKIGVPVDQFGDSTGELRLLPSV